MSVVPTRNSSRLETGGRVAGACFRHFGAMLAGFLRLPKPAGYLAAGVAVGQPVEDASTAEPAEVLWQFDTGG